MDVDSRDSGIYDAVPMGADVCNLHRGSVDKHRFITRGYQVSEFRDLYIVVVFPLQDYSTSKLF